MSKVKALRLLGGKVISPVLLGGLSLLFWMVLGIFLYPIRAQAAEGDIVYDSGNSDFYYVILSEAIGGVGTVELRGSMIGGAYTSNTGIQIPATITVSDGLNDGTYKVVSIGSNAFANCSGVTGSLTIPDSVVSIGEYAFYWCDGLTGSLTIPSSVVSIGEYAFYLCDGLTGSLAIPSSVTSIGEYAFYYCDGFTGSLTIPSSVTSIGEYAFGYCSGFTGSLTIPSSVVSIGECAFYYCDGFTGSLTIPSSVVSIGDFAFGYCDGFTGSLTIPDSVESIGDCAFLACSSLTGSLTIPDSVTSIGLAAFYECHFTEVDSYVDSSVMAVAFLSGNDFSPLYDFSKVSLTCPAGSSAGYAAMGFIQAKITERSDNVNQDTKKTKQELSPYVAFGKEWADLLLSAEKGESLKLRTDVWVSFPGYVMEALAARRDLTLELTYKYEGVWYQTIIPAGAEVPTGVPYAGFFGYLGGMYGRTVL